MSVDNATIYLSDAEFAERPSEILDGVVNGEHDLMIREGRELAVIIPPAAGTTNPEPAAMPSPAGESAFDEEFERNTRAFREWANTARFESQSP